MPAGDLYHDTVVQALIADGWTITGDPLRLSFGARDFYIDLAAELPIAAERGEQRIAVEVKSFVGASNIRELELAVGQFALYREVLARSEAGRTLYMAVSVTIQETFVRGADRAPHDRDAVTAIAGVRPDEREDHEMDAIERYQQSVDKLMHDYAAFGASREKVEAVLIVDAERRHYLLMFMGWDGPRRVHHVAIHVELIGDKVWLQCDNTDLVVAEDLVAAGIPREAIVLGFRAPEVRKYTEYAMS